MDAAGRSGGPAVREFDGVGEAADPIRLLSEFDSEFDELQPRRQASLGNRRRP